MAITLITGPANAGKAQVVMDGVRAHLARGEEPLLVVPTRADAEHYLRELAGAGSALGARVELFDGLIGEAVRRAGVAEPLLGEGARRRALAALAGRVQGGPGAAGFVSALAGVIAELQVRRVTPARLSQALGGWVAAEGGEAHAGEHAAELAGLFTIAVALIVPTGAQAAPVKQYVLKHPKREHCRAHYVKKVERVKKREHGRTVKVRETVCVHVAPKPAAKVVAPAPPVVTVAPTPAPSPSAPATPTPEPPHIIPTTTTESVSNGWCETVEVPGYYPTHLCHYVITATTLGNPSPSMGDYEWRLAANGVTIYKAPSAGSHCEITTQEYEEPTRLIASTGPGTGCAGSNWSESTSQGFPHEAIRWSVTARFRGAGLTAAAPLGWAESQSEVLLSS